MALDTDALRLREIERGSKFSPIQFGDIARTAIGVGQQFQAGQQALADNQQSRDDAQLKRKQANDMQKLLNGGVQAVLQVMGQMPEEDQKLIFGGDKNTIESLGKDSEGLLNLWKRVSEVQIGKQVSEAPDRTSQAGLLLKGDPKFGGKEFLGATKPAKGESKLSNEIKIELLNATKDFKAKNGRPPNDQEQSELNAQVALKNNLGDVFVDKVAQDLVKVAGSAKDQRTQAFQERKFDNTALAKVVENIDKGADIISSIQSFDKAVGGINTANFANFISKDLVEGIKNRTLIGETDESIISLLINKVSGIDEDKKSRQALQNRLTKDPEFQKLVKSPEFNSIFIPLATMLNTVLADRSGAAVTEGEFKRLKPEFGIDIFGTPESFVQGIRLFSDRFKTKQVNYLNTLDEKQLSLFTQRIETRGGIDPRDLPSITSLAPKVQLQIEDIDADLELLK